MFSSENCGEPDHFISQAELLAAFNIHWRQNVGNFSSSSSSSLLQLCGHATELLLDKT